MTELPWRRQSPGRGPVWVRADTVLALHRRLLAEHGGRPGLREAGALADSLAAPRNPALYRHASLSAIAAAYLRNFARTRPFHDGSSQVAWTCARLFLRLNGCDLRADPAAVLNLVRAVAEGRAEQGVIAAWIEERMQDLHSC